MKNLHFSRKRSIIILVLFYAIGAKRPQWQQFSKNSVFCGRLFYSICKG